MATALEETGSGGPIDPQADLQKDREADGERRTRVVPLTSCIKQSGVSPNAKTNTWNHAHQLTLQPGSSHYMDFNLASPLRIHSFSIGDHPCETSTGPGGSFAELKALGLR